jgi:hypothetical protein
MFITPDTSPNTMRTSNVALITQPEATTEDNQDVFNDIESLTTQTHQRDDDDWCAPMATPLAITRIQVPQSAAVTKAGELLDSQAKNWSGWSQAMELLFDLFGIQEYVSGTVARPDAAEDPTSTRNWKHNDTFARLLITSNIANSEKIYTNGCMSAHHMWTNLQTMHESKSHLILTTHLRTLMTSFATDDDNIPKHLTKLKQCWDQLSLFGDTKYRVSKFLFKRIIASLLPESWDQFTDQFVAGQLDIVKTDPRKHIDSQQLIGIIKQEYKHKQSRRSGVAKPSEHALYTQTNRRDNACPPLANHITRNTYNHGPSSSMFCKICECTNHITTNCRYKGKPKCGQCGRFGHNTDKCWHAGGD